MRYKIRSVEEKEGKIIVREIKARRFSTALLRFEQDTQLKGELFRPERLIKFT